jgi:hypothetical protein
VTEKGERTCGNGSEICHGSFAGRYEKIMNNTGVYRMSFAGVYPHYIQKAEKKNRTKAEVDEIIFWLSGDDKLALQQHLDDEADFQTFFAQAPNINPNAAKITGIICGYRVEEIEDKLTRQISKQDGRR